MRNSLADSSMPNHRITSGISASAGMLRTIWMVESSSVSNSLMEPVSKPSSRPRPPPIASPVKARPALTRTWVQSSPDTVRAQAALTTSSGAGSTRVESQPCDEAICHSTMRPMGTAQGKRRCAALARKRTTGAGNNGPSMGRSTASATGDTCSSLAVCVMESSGSGTSQLCDARGTKSLATVSPNGPSGLPNKGLPLASWLRSGRGSSGNTSSAKR